MNCLAGQAAATKAHRVHLFAGLGSLVELRFQRRHADQFALEDQDRDVADPGPMPARWGNYRVYPNFSPRKVVAAEFNSQLFGLEVFLKNFPRDISLCDAVVSGEHQVVGDQCARAVAFSATTRTT